MTRNSFALGLALVTGMAFASACAQVDGDDLGDEDLVGQSQHAVGCPYTTTDVNQFHTQYVLAFNADVPADIGCLYEGNATFVDPATGTLITGRSNIQNQLSFYQAGTHMVATTRYAIVGGGNTALASASYQILDDSTNGVVAAGQSADVLRRQSNGTWLLVVDHPFGGQ